MRVNLSLILGARSLEYVRWARHHLYVLLVLSPLVLGLTYFGVSQLLLDNEWRPSIELTVVSAVALTAALVVLSMSRAGAELYHLRRPESLFDTLPVSADTHLWAALLERLARTLFVGFAFVLARKLNGGTLDHFVLPPIALFLLVTALAEILAATFWIHWSHLRNASVALSGIAMLLVCSAIGGSLLVSSLLGENLQSLYWRLSLVVALVCLPVLFVLVRALHGRWRAVDLEYVRRIGEQHRLPLIPSRLARFWKDSAASPLLERDLALTIRGFSSVVYLAFGLAGAWIFVLSGLLTSKTVVNLEFPQGVADLTWLPTILAIKITFVLSAVSMTVITPVLVAHQIPHLWLERSTGVKGADLSRAKLWYARAITFPTAIATWLVGLLSGGCPLIYAVPLLIEILWLWWLISTVAGGLAYEVPDQAGLGAILTVCAGLAIGLFVAFLWPLGLALYGFGVGELCRRGEHRARFHLLTEGE